MAKYLFSFPSAAMVVPDGEWEAVGHDSHAVIDEAKVAGVYVLGRTHREGLPMRPGTARLPVRAAVLIGVVLPCSMSLAAWHEFRRAEVDPIKAAKELSKLMDKRTSSPD